MLLVWVLLQAAEPFDRALDDLVFDAARELEKLEVSPVAIGPVTVSANLADQAADALVARMQVQLAKIPTLQQVVCAECFSVRSEVKDGQWVVTRGLVDREAYLRIGQAIGAKAFVLMGLDWIEGDKQALALDIRVVKASTGLVMFARRLYSHETSQALKRTNQRVAQTEASQRAELERLLEGRPRYAHATTLAYWLLPVTARSVTGYGAVTAAYRLYEQFGPQNALVYGFQLNFYLTPSQPVIAGGAITGVFGGTVSFNNTLVPRLRFLAQAGAFVAGAYGNTLMVGALAEIITRLGVGLVGGAQYFVHAEGTQGEVGGAGFTIGANYVFE